MLKFLKDINWTRGLTAAAITGVTFIVARKGAAYAFDQWIVPAVKG